MTQAERLLLLNVAKALSHLLFWRNIDGRSTALALDEQVKAVEAEHSDGVIEPHPPSRRCQCVECRAYPWKDDGGVQPLSQSSEDEAAAVKFYTENPKAALFDFGQRTKRNPGVMPIRRRDELIASITTKLEGIADPEMRNLDSIKPLATLALDSLRELADGVKGGA